MQDHLTNKNGMFTHIQNINLTTLLKANLTHVKSCMRRYARVQTIVVPDVNKPEICIEIVLYQR